MGKVEGREGILGPLLPLQRGPSQVLPHLDASSASHGQGGVVFCFLWSAPYRIGCRPSLVGCTLPCQEEGQPFGAEPVDLNLNLRSSWDREVHNVSLRVNRAADVFLEKPGRVLSPKLVNTSKKLND